MYRLPFSPALSNIEPIEEASPMQIVLTGDMEIHAEQILRTKEMGDRILSENTGQTIERIRKDFERVY